MKKIFFGGGGARRGVWGLECGGGVGLARGMSFGFIARRRGHAPALRICCKSRQGELNLERGRAVAGLECGGGWGWRVAYHLVLSRGGGGHAPTLRICCILSHILARSLMRSLTCNRRTILPGGAGTWDVTCDGLEEWFSYYIIFTYGRVFYAGTIVYVWTVFLRGTVVFTCVLFLYVWTGVLRGAIFSGTVFCGRRGFRSCSLRRWRG